MIQADRTPGRPSKRRDPASELLLAIAYRGTEQAQLLEAFIAAARGDLAGLQALLG
jgi:hypothetical protein